MTEANYWAEGWLKKQLDSVSKDIKTWPAWMQRGAGLMDGDLAYTVMGLADIEFDVKLSITRFQSMSDDEVAQFGCGLFNNLETNTTVAELALRIREWQKAKMDCILAELAHWKTLLDDDPSEETLAVMEWFCQQWKAAERLMTRMGYVGCPDLVPPHIVKHHKRSH